MSSFMRVKYEVSAALERNVIRVLEHGPRLTISYEQVVLARRLNHSHDSDDRYSTQWAETLIGGYGGMGVGVAWVPYSEEHKQLIGWESSPVVQ